MKPIGKLVLEQAAKKVADFEAFPTALAGLRNTLDGLTTPEGRLQHRLTEDRALFVIATPANTIVADVARDRIPSMVGLYDHSEGLNLIALAVRQGDLNIIPEIYIGMLAPDFVPPTSDDPKRPVAAVIGVFEGDRGAGFEAWLPPCCLPRWIN